MAKKPCMKAGCPNLVDRGKQGYCDDHQERRCSVRTEAARRGSPHRALYNTRWANYSKARLRQHPLCEGLRLRRGGEVKINTHPGRVVAAVLTDHIEPHKGNEELFWDTENHQSGCKDCHDVKTATEDGGFGRSASVRG